MKNISEQYENTTDRELRIERLLNASRELVWEVWTKPEHLAQWWGPNGFTNTIQQMDVKNGGIWNLIMHGPDGTDYRNESLYTEVIKPERLVYEHITGPKFRATVIFKEQGNKTLLTMTMVFDTAEQKDKVVKEFNAAEGQVQTITRLEMYLSNF